MEKDEIIASTPWARSASRIWGTRLEPIIVPEGVELKASDEQQEKTLTPAGQNSMLAAGSLNSTPGLMGFDQSAFAKIVPTYGMKEKAEIDRLNFIQVCGLIACVVAFTISQEITYKFITLDHGDCVPFTEGPQWAAFIILLSQMTITVSSFVMMFAVFKYHKLQLKITSLKRNYSLGRHHQLRWMTVEILICLFHCPPGVYECFEEKLLLLGGDDPPPIRYSIQLLNVFLAMRIFVVVRYMYHKGRFSSNTGRIVLNLFNQKKSMALVLKDQLNKNTIGMFSVLYFGLMIVFAYIILLFERSTQRLMVDIGLRTVNTTYGQCLWYVWTIMSTVGLGDWYPISIYGRWASVVVGILGAAVSAMMISIIYFKLQYSPEEKKMALMLSLINSKGKVGHQATRLIWAWWRFVSHRSVTAKRAYLYQISRWNRLKRRVFRYESFLQTPGESELFSYVKDLSRGQARSLEKVQMTVENGLRKLREDIENLLEAESKRRYSNASSPFPTSAQNHFQKKSTLEHEPPDVNTQLSRILSAFESHADHVSKSLQRLEFRQDALQFSIQNELKNFKSPHSLLQHNRSMRLETEESPTAIRASPTRTSPTAIGVEAVFEFPHTTFSEPHRSLVDRPAVTNIDRAPSTPLLNQAHQKIQSHHEIDLTSTKYQDGGKKDLHKKRPLNVVVDFLPLKPLG